MPPRLLEGTSLGTKMDDKNGGSTSGGDTSSTVDNGHQQRPPAPLAHPSSAMAAAAAAYQLQATAAMYSQFVQQSQFDPYLTSGSHFLPAPPGQLLHHPNMNTFPNFAQLPYLPGAHQLPLPHHHLASQQAPLSAMATFKAAMNYAYNSHSPRYFSPQQQFNPSNASGEPQYGQRPPPRRNNNFNNLIQLVDNDASEGDFNSNKSNKASPNEEMQQKNSELRGSVNGLRGDHQQKANHLQQWSLSAMPPVSTTLSQSESSNYRSNRNNERRYTSEYRSRDREDDYDSRRHREQRLSRGQSRSRSRSRSRSQSRPRYESRSQPRKVFSRGHQGNNDRDDRTEHHKRTRRSSVERSGDDRKKSVSLTRKKDDQLAVDTVVVSNRSKMKSGMEELLNSPGAYIRCFPLEPYYRQSSVLEENVTKTSMVATGSDRLLALRQTFTESVLEKAAAVRSSKPAFSYPKRRVKLRRSNKLHGKSFNFGYICKTCLKMLSEIRQVQRLRFRERV